MVQDFKGYVFATSMVDENILWGKRTSRVSQCYVNNTISAYIVVETVVFLFKISIFLVL